LLSGRANRRRVIRAGGSSAILPDRPESDAAAAVDGLNPSSTALKEQFDRAGQEMKEAWNTNSPMPTSGRMIPYCSPSARYESRWM
jgi:hypothetical protein